MIFVVSCDHDRRVYYQCANVMLRSVVLDRLTAAYMLGD